ncbi:MAG: class I SAM-dependent RNA methyltransferase, partial [Ruminiclostridium sp.]|nr:class I SAM-dependent RNA methyltransferase [Ruminiclostridium sp.]
IDPEAVRLTEENARKAGVSGLISVRKCDIRDFHCPAGCTKIITNPPYGERLGELDEAKELCRVMGETLLPRDDRGIYVITALEDFEELFGEKASKNRKLYNGMLMCRLYSYI